MASNKYLETWEKYKYFLVEYVIWCYGSHMYMYVTAIQTYNIHLGKHQACVQKGIATDKALFSSEKCWYFSYFSTKAYVVGTH